MFRARKFDGGVGKPFFWFRTLEPTDLVRLLEKTTRERCDAVPSRVGPGREIRHRFRDGSLMEEKRKPVKIGLVGVGPWVGVLKLESVVQGVEV